MRATTGMYMILLALALTARVDSHAQLYTRYTTPQTIDSLVLKQFSGSGVEIMNVQYTGFFLGGSDSTQPVMDIGFFNGQNTSIGIDSGIILSAGYLHPPYALGIPAYYYADDQKYSPGDALIDSIIAPLHSIDAAVLEFDFIPNGDTIKFNYVFASDEYPGNNCYEDADAFFFHISGPGIVGQQNIALVPVTGEYVSVGSINNGIPWGGDSSDCISLTNTQYYVDHTLDTTLIFNGSTVVMTASAATIPCEVYHLRFAVADVSSASEDGAVFLKSNSFNSEPISIDPSVSYGGPDTLLYEDCGFATLVIRRTYDLLQSKTYAVNYGGNAVYGTDYNAAPLTITLQPGQMYDTLLIYPTADFIADNGEILTVSIGDTLCNGDYFITDVEMTINEKQGLTANIFPHSGGFCDTVLFISTVAGFVPPLQYNWQSGISTDTAYSLFQIGQQTITLQVTDGCGQMAFDTAAVSFDDAPVADFSFMPDYPDLLNPEVVFIDQSSLNVTYWFWQLGYAGLTSSLQNPSINYAVPDTYFVSLTVANDIQCTDTIIKPVVVHELPTLYIPNSFTPNDDHMNDIFMVRGKEIAFFSMHILDRWGKEVFSTNDPQIGWDGKINGVSATAGVYAIRVEYSFNKAPSDIRVRLERINLLR